MRITANLMVRQAYDNFVFFLRAHDGFAAGIGFWQSGNVWSVAALQDWVAGTTVNRDAVLGNLNKVAGLYDHYDRYG
jgi:hypothetical protein